MKRRDILLASLILIAAWQLLAMAIHRDTTTVVPTPLVVMRLKPCGNGCLRKSGCNAA
jgi:hypothetical protein